MVCSKYPLFLRGRLFVVPDPYSAQTENILFWEEQKMKKSMTLSYEVGKGLYLNITNKCPCNCTFCIRNNGDGAYGSDPLWLERQPAAVEIIEDLKSRDLDGYDEIVFCGYGEPTCELEILKETARYIRPVTN